MGHGSKAGPACLALGHHQAGPVLGASGGSQEEAFGKYEPVCVRKDRRGDEKRARRKEEKMAEKRQNPPALKAPRPQPTGTGVREAGGVTSHPQLQTDL